jgi:hypothetical protein
MGPNPTIRANNKIEMRNGARRRLKYRERDA